MRVVAALAVLALIAAGCGGDASGSQAQPRLVVAVAASLTEALEACSDEFAGADVALSFAGSDELAAQIRQGVRPDVYAAADTALPDALAAEGLLEPPVTFASNRLVVAVPAGAGAAAAGSLAALGEPGTDVVIGSASVPVGAYTRAVLARLDPSLERRILANVRSEEPDVKGVIGKVAGGAADAGFAYATDVAAAGDALAAIALPAAAQPEVAYAAGVVRGASRPALARRFVAGLTDGPCGAALADAGFGPPPPR